MCTPAETVPLPTGARPHCSRGRLAFERMSGLMADAAESMHACAECGGPLRPVQVKTLKHVLKYDLARRLEDGTFGYCPDPDCDIVYVRISPESGVGTSDQVFRQDDIKDRARPGVSGRERYICYCFGYTAGEIEDDAAQDVNAIPLAIARDVRAGNCACEVMNPSGH